jgi:L-ascorbate metabolism protein UlaG (beta-lactamase superfamily)
VVSKIKPKAAIPCRYDMFPDNAVDPRQFRASLKLFAPDTAYQELEHGKPFSSLTVRKTFHRRDAETPRNEFYAARVDSSAVLIP